MRTITNPAQDSTQDVLAALRQIQNTPDMQVEAATQPETLVNRLGLSGIARHAVLFAITAAIVLPATHNVVHPDGFWQ